MDRSIEFIMPENEEYKLLNFINGRDDIVILSAASKSCSPAVIKDFYKTGENIFWKKAYIAKNSDIKRIKMTYVKSCSHFIIEDVYEAPVIEIRRSGNNKMNARMWVSLYFSNACDKIYKGEEFENLYKSFEKWIEINCKIIQPIGFKCRNTQCT